jgi:hypothetical protein
MSGCRTVFMLQPIIVQGDPVSRGRATRGLCCGDARILLGVVWDLRWI